MPTHDLDSSVRRCQRVLSMVHELHKRGHQRLRVMPGISPSGTSWRCSITPLSNILRTHGAMSRDYEMLTAQYTSGMENEYFGWPDARTDTARALADKFVERFPEIVEVALGRDWEYVGWYTEMLGIAEQGFLPVAYADWWDPPQPGVLLTMPPYPRGLAMPPGGEAEPDVEEPTLSDDATLTGRGHPQLRQPD